MTNPKLNAEIVSILRISDSPHCQYAAERIEELGAEVERLKRYDGNDEHPENRCQRCGGRNLHNWYADSDEWNKVVGDTFGVLCPFCFAELASEVGIAPAAWRLSREGDFPERLQHAEALLRQIWEQADAGELDWIDLEWMAACDLYFEAAEAVGEEE